MNTLVSRFIYIGLFFLLIFLSGLWLNHTGKPYGVILLTIHKLIALGAVVFLVVIVYRSHQAAPLGAPAIAAAAATVLMFIATIAAGGLESIDATGGLAGVSQSVRSAIALAHWILPFLTLLSTAATLYLVTGIQS
jgi:hypothetical protein